MEPYLGTWYLTITINNQVIILYLFKKNAHLISMNSESF